MSTRYLGSVPLRAPSSARKKRRRRRVRVELSSNISVPLTSPDNLDSSGLELQEWGLPTTVFKGYKSVGIDRMFPWQAECLRTGKALEGRNLVYSAPTSAGKTLVAEILLLKAVIEKKKKGIVILPFVSLAREKMKSLQKLLKDSNIRVEGFMGSMGPRGGLARADIAVCTIEKANSLLNRAMEEGKGLESIGIIVVDELHLVGDSSRGYLLELMLTKIRYIAQGHVQIVGMSATLPNLDLIAEWLDADLYITDFRPIPLNEMIKVDHVLYSNSFERIKVLDSLSFIKNDSDCLIQLCLETVVDGHSILVFCPTKSWCEKMAEAIAKEFYNIGMQNGSVKSEEFVHYGNMLRKELDGVKLKAVIESLKRTPAGLDPMLSKTVAFGVSFHHAGLTMDERDIVENSFKQGILRVLVATSTLSSGVNLPARRVIIRSPFTYQNKLIDSLSYRQMIGRAGRKGIDTKGESILFCRENERPKVEQLVKSNLESVQSCLVQLKSDNLCSSMKRAILEIIAGNVAKNQEEVYRYTSCTMLAASLRRQGSQSDIPENSISLCIEFLENNEFIRTQEVSSKTSYVATQLGLACLASSLSPDEGLQVFDELNKARKCFVLENELHIVYLLVPIYAAVSWPNLDWMNYLTLWESLSSDLKRVGEIVGIEERFLIRAMRGTVNQSVPKQMKSMATHQRFYTALALNDLVNEIPLYEVTKKYGASKGMLQSLQQAASTFAGMVTAFCAKLGWHNLELLISQFQNRLQFGVQRELVDLCRLSTLNGQRARVLYNASLESIASIANSNSHAIENILTNSCPFETKKRCDSESEAKERQELQAFWITGLKGVTIKEGAEMILSEARALLQKDLGMELHWNDEAEKEANQLKRQREINDETGGDVSSKKTKLSQRIFQIPNGSVLQSEILKSPSTNGGKNHQSKLYQQANRRKSRLSEELSKLDKSECDFNNTSLNISSIVDEIFENEEFSVIQPSQKSKKKVSFGKPDDSEVDMFGNEDDHIFLDSWKVEDMEESKVRKNEIKLNNKSCPRTPKYDACSEELDLWVAPSSNDEEDAFSDSVISDSLLEKAFNTHMHSDDTVLNKENVMMEEHLDHNIFKEFSKEIKRLKGPLVFSIAASRHAPLKLNNGAGVIGKKFTKIAPKECSKTELLIIESMELVIDGVAFSWECNNNDAYYLCLNHSQSNPNDTICPPSQDLKIPLAEKLKLLESIFKCLKDFISFDIKEQVKALYLGAGIWPSIDMKYKDPKIASWLLNPGGREKTLSSLIMEFCPLTAPLLNTLGSHKGTGSVSLSKDSVNSSRSRSLAEVLLTKHLMREMEDKLITLDLHKSFVDVEMPSLLSFLAMELNGVGFSEDESSLQKKFIIQRMEELEKMAYKAAGRSFSLTSPEDLVKVLYFELKLPANGREDVKATSTTLSTNKETLIRLKKYHRLPEVILEWRKLNAAVTKVVYPMQRAKSYHKGLGMHRIYTIVLTNTSTGRISLVEPNIQNIPKDFEIDVKSSSLHETSMNHSAEDKTIGSILEFLNDSCDNQKYKVSMRHSIIASKESLIVAADYSQLELRILAHLCGDWKLKNILNDGQDVFKLIASKWKKKEVMGISDVERQSAKQMCYGILYGIGPKALGEQLGVPQEEASVFMSDFKDTFPQIRTFIEKTIAACREKGFVKTMTGRRRYLPNIQTSKSIPSASYIISHAERQAVNTTIQGSAADLVKMAMININRNISKFYANCAAPLRKDSRSSLKGGYFILQVHDELLYEVASKYVSDVAHMIKIGMEKACTLSVVTPVSIKVGPSWGTLRSFNF